MDYAHLPTFLGGEMANLDWEDLSPKELLQTTVSSLMRAEHIAVLAIKQSAAADEFGEREAASEYKQTARFLTAMTSKQAEVSLPPLRNS